ARGGDDVVTGVRDVQERSGGGSHAGAECDGVDAALEGVDAVLEDLNGGVRQAGVDRARIFEREALLGVLGAVEDVAGGHVDRQVTGNGRIHGLPGVDLLGGTAPVC